MRISNVTKKAGALLASLALVSSSAWANFGGKIYCDANCNSVFDNGDAPLAGVTVNAYLCGTSTLVGSTTTAPDGSYSFSPSATMPLGQFYYTCAVLPPGYTQGLNPGNPGYACTSVCFTFAEPCDCTHNIGLCPTNGTCSPTCTNCVDPVFGLGAAAGISVLELGPASVSITGPAGGVIGDVSIAAGGKLSMSGSQFISGTVRLGPGATFTDSSSGNAGSVQQNVDLSAQIAAAYAAYSSASNMPCTQTFALLDGKAITTITGNAGVNVICVKDIVLAGRQIVLTGPSSAKFIFNISGKFVFTGGGYGPQIRVDQNAGIQTSAVLYNVLGSGADVAFSGGGGGANCCAAIVDGTILAPYRKIALSPGLVNGEVISGKDISIVSGSSVRCPPCPPVGASPQPKPPADTTVSPSTESTTAN